MKEDLELLKATIAVAVADGELRRSELGVVAGLARRAGIGQASFDAMVQAAQTDATFAQNTFLPPVKARQAVVLLASQARIDGEISPEERRVIVRIATCLGIAGDDFRAAYEEGIKRADAIRARRSGSSGRGTVAAILSSMAFRSIGSWRVSSSRATRRQKVAIPASDARPLFTWTCPLSSSQT